MEESCQEQAEEEKLFYLELFTIKLWWLKKTFENSRGNKKEKRQF